MIIYRTVDISYLHYDSLAATNEFSLQEAGVEIEPFGDLNTEAERKLGKLVLEK